MLVVVACSREKEQAKILGCQQSPSEPIGAMRPVCLAAGMSWRGYTYEDLMRLGSGTHELQLPRPPILRKTRESKKKRRRTNSRPVR